MADSPFLIGAFSERKDEDIFMVDTSGADQDAEEQAPISTRLAKRKALEVRWIIHCRLFMSSFRASL